MINIVLETYSVLELTYIAGYSCISNILVPSPMKPVTISRDIREYIPKMSSFNDEVGNDICMCVPVT
jgi:hypothetical protein